MSTEHIRFITVGFADMIANLPDPDVIKSEPELADYWPEDDEAVCDACGRDDHTPAELADCIDSALVPYDYRADYDGPLTEDV